MEAKGDFIPVVHNLRFRTILYCKFYHIREERVLKIMFFLYQKKRGFPCGSAGRETASNAGDLGSIPGLGRFPWRKERLPTPVFWPREFHGLHSPWGCKELDKAERLPLSYQKITSEDM